MGQARGLGIDGPAASSQEEGTVRARARLHPGHHSFWREEVDGVLRARIVGAMVAVAAEHGFLGASVGRVVRRAGVSRRAFYEIFDGRESCFEAAFDWGVERASGQMVQAYALSSWRERVRGAVAALLAFLDSEPELARVCVIEALGAGSAVLERRARVLQRAADALRADAPAPPGSPEPPLLTAETIVGGAFAAIHTRLSLRDAGRSRAQSGSSRAGRARPGPPSELLGQLMALIVLPYLGPEAAGEELTRLPPELPRRRDDTPAVIEDADGGR
jgi:AcrR family transcriptional regulator